MLEELDVQVGANVLEVGAGSGYNAALLASLAGSEGGVTTIEIDDEVAEHARSRLQASRFTSVKVESMDGWLASS